jgi:hypothetical protein
MSYRAGVVEIARPEPGVDGDFEEMGVMTLFTARTALLLPSVAIEPLIKQMRDTNPDRRPLHAAIRIFRISFAQ